MERNEGRPADKTALIRAIQGAHERMARLIEHLSDEQLVEPAMGDWTGKDLLAHMTWWHDHSARVIQTLRAGREPYEANDPANATDAVNSRIHREHLRDPPELARRAFTESFHRLLAALEPLTDDDLFADDRWAWLGGEALAETVLWDSSRHYEAHQEHLEGLRKDASNPS
jgi:hypothetical protein